MEKIAQYLGLVIGSMFKFFLGPAAGISLGLSIWETAICTILGMMISVILFTYFGPYLLNWLGLLFRREPRTFSRRSRRLVRYRQSFGLYGVALFTPLLFTPILGTLLAVSLGANRRKILVTMLISAVFWGFVVTWLMMYLKKSLVG